MGSKYEVYEWWDNKEKGGGPRWHFEHGGKWLLKALYVMWQLKRNGAKMVKLECV